MHVLVYKNLSHDAITKEFVGKSLITRQCRESVRKELKEQDKLFAGFETRIKRRGKEFYV